MKKKCEKGNNISGTSKNKKHTKIKFKVIDVESKRIAKPITALCQEMPC